MGGDPSGFEDADPIRNHPVPALRGIDATHGRARAAAGLAEARVAVDRVSEVGAVGGICKLVVKQLAFIGEGDFSLEVLERVDSQAGEFGGLELIGRYQFLQ